MMIVDDDILFVSNEAEFRTPQSTLNSINNIVDSDSESVDLEAPEKLEVESIPPVLGGYRVSRVLGKGAFGEVRVGEHQLTGEKVALKFLRKADILSIGAAERTSTEIQCLSALKHNNIIRLQQVCLLEILTVLAWLYIL